jgi:hypothetical protein
MKDVTPLVKVEEFSPDRCQSNNAFAQCRLKKIPGSDYCAIHSGAGNNIVKNNLSMYRLTKYRARLKEFAEYEGIKSLRDEIGILRIMVEEIMNKCQSDTDIILYSSKISDLVTRIEKAVATCHKIDKDSGFYLDQTQVVLFAERMIQIIMETINSDTEKEIVATKIQALLFETNDPRFGKQISVDSSDNKLTETSSNVP